MPLTPVGNAYIIIWQNGCPFNEAHLVCAGISRKEQRCGGSVGIPMVIWMPWPSSIINLKFMWTVSLRRLQLKGRTGRPCVIEETVRSMQESFIRSPRNSVSRTTGELQAPESMGRRTVRKGLQIYQYKLQLIQKLNLNNPTKWVL
jgi:hypothetical protein